MCPGGPPARARDSTPTCLAPRKNVQPRIYLDLPPKDEKEKQNQKAEDKAARIQAMDEHRIPLEELCYRFGTNVDTGTS